MIPPISSKVLLSSNLFKLRSIFVVSVTSCAFRGISSQTSVSTATRRTSSSSSMSGSTNQLRSKLGVSPTELDSDSYFTIAVSGASGLVGNALLNELKSRNYIINHKPVQMIQLVRDKTTTITKQRQEHKLMPLSIVCWNPHATTDDEDGLLDKLVNVDAIINLSGEDISTGVGLLGFLGIRPWTPEKKKSVLASRVPGARVLANIAQQIVSKEEERSITYLCASGVGVYGFDNPSADESTPVSNSQGFLATVSHQWEEAANSASTPEQIRVVNMRFGVVLSKKGGALGKLYPIYYMGGGGVVGTGDQYFSYISARDAARAILHILETPSLEGPVNVTSPQPCTYRDFNTALGNVLNRPTIVPLPSFAVNLLFGEMGREVLLGGVHANPSKLLDTGFEFKHNSIEKAVESALTESI